MGGKVGSGSDWGPGEGHTGILVSESRDGGGIDIARRDRSVVNISYLGDLFASYVCEL